MNSHSLALMLVLSDDESGKRLRNNETAEGSRVAVLYGLRKDHKMRPMLSKRSFEEKDLIRTLYTYYTVALEEDTL